MRNIIVKVHPSKANLKKKDQLAWKIAEIASDKAKINNDAVEMVINRIIDNASVAIASFNRQPVISARQMALAHPRKNGANIFGLNNKIKEGIQSANPPPKGCSASQRNIATQQAGEIDNLESRVLAFGAQLKLLEDQVKQQKEQIGINNNKISGVAQANTKAAQAALAEGPDSIKELN